MALHFSANQYEKAFHPKRLQNWEVSKVHRAPVHPLLKHLPDVDEERPKSHDGFSEIIVTDRGHLKPGVPRSYKNPWGNFVGTWDQKCHLLGNYVSNSTARANQATEKYDQMVQDGDDAPLINTTTNHKGDLTQKATEILPVNALEESIQETEGEKSVKDSPGSRSGARTPDLRDHYTDSPIPRPSRSAIMTPTYNQVTARHTEEKACQIDRYPSPRLNTQANGMSEGIGSCYPDGHHFMAY